MLLPTRRPVLLAATRASWLLLAFVAGAAVHYYRVPPGQFLDDAFRAARAWRIQRQALATPYPLASFHKARTDARGVTVHVPDRAWDGYVAYSAPTAEPGVELIDLTGQRLRSWPVPFEALRRSAIGERLPDRAHSLIVRRAHLHPDGHALAILESSAGRTPWGIGLILLGPQAELRWVYPGFAHHDLSLAPDGRIFVLVQEVLKERIEGVPFEPPMIVDAVVELSPDGRELGRTYVPQAIRDSAFAHVLDFDAQASRGDYLHVNSVRYIDEATAATFPFAREGQVAVYARQIDALVVVDLTTKRATWIRFGFWRRGHDPDLLPNGNVLLFDNEGVYGPGGTSRLVEVDLETMALVWEYRGTPSQPLKSRTRAGQQRLENGNTFIFETAAGRLLEVTPSKEIVWEYYHPQRLKQGKVIPPMVWAERFAPDYFTPGLLRP
ncbi:MAG: hypothetical protein JRI23_31930 [Deltaproteobacteria bacterium]|nr:hypothetical protein [Deltaproteobacteria bacterium]MBW2536834.1 hypothetical protein [Deltaproteobacteria bacterium]